ncbi:MAG: flagellar basal-body MS-ring/collar protein FliF [Candidatus Kapabacteria bacterium]|nr:flagellar basal-body MS-ring/collar protein FliF [Candidatus Kapabacteria bacterium]
MAESQVISQVKQFYNKLVLWQKIVIGSVLILVIGGLITLLSSGKDVEMGTLFTSLDENDAGQIINKLKEKLIKYELKDNGNTILVDKKIVADTRLALAAEGLPQTSVAGYDIFDKTNLGMSEFVQKLNYKRALEGELARTIGALEEIKKVRVHIVLPEKALFDKDQKEPTASVSLKLKNGKSLNKISIEGIQHLVASSVEGLKPDAVTIVDQRGKIINEPALDTKTVAGLTNAQYEQQRKVEQYLAEKAQSLLDGVIGQGNSEVRVNAELDFTQIEKTITDFDPERQVIRSEQNIVDNNKSSDSLSYPAVNMDKKSSNVISNYEISKTVEKIVQGVGNVKRLSVAGLINGKNKIIEKEGKKEVQYLPRDQKDMDNLTLIIKNAVGYDPNRNDQVSIINVEFDTMTPEEDFDQVLQGPWWKNHEYQKIIFLVVSLLIILLVIYRILHSKQVRERLRLAFSLPEHVHIDEEDHEEVEEELEEIDLGEDDLMLLPAELPEQLLLEGMREERESEEAAEFTDGFDKASLAEQARARLDDFETEEMTEDKLIKIEIKNKVASYLDNNTEDSVRLIRMFFSQDIENNP